MGLFDWVLQHGGNLLQNIGIIAGLFFSAASFRLSTEAHRISQVHGITSSHRELWSQLIDNPPLARVLHMSPDLETTPITAAEERFVTLLILHLRGVYQTMALEPVVSREELESDIHSFFALPIPGIVWQRVKKFQDSGFVEFVESCCGVAGNNWDSLANMQKGDNN